MIERRERDQRRAAVDTPIGTPCVHGDALGGFRYKHVAQGIKNNGPDLLQVPSYLDH